MEFWYFIIFFSKTCISEHITHSGFHFSATRSRLNPRSSSSSSCRTASMDLPGPLLPLISIVHRSRKVFQATSSIGTELLYIGTCWSSYICSSMWWGPQEYIAYEFVLTSPAVFRMSGSSNLDSFRDGWLVDVQLLLCGVCDASIQQVSKRLLLGINCVLLNRSVLTSIWPIVYG